MLNLQVTLQLAGRVLACTVQVGPHSGQSPDHSAAFVGSSMSDEADDTSTFGFRIVERVATRARPAQVEASQT